MSEVTKNLPSTLRTIGVAVALALGLATSAGAVTINQGLTSGVLNTVEDQDREAYIDVNANGLIDVGDVFIGFVRIDNFLPAGLDASNQVYGIISNQITGTDPGDPNLVTLGVTTHVGLRLQDITGDANTAGGLVAVYDSAAPFTTDLINNSAPGATGIKDDIDLILNEGTLRLVGDLGAADNFLTADVITGFGVGSPNGIFVGLPPSIEFGGFSGGLSVAYNNTAFSYLDAVFVLDPITGLQTAQIGISGGTFKGAAGDGNEGVFTNASQYLDGGGDPFAQCSTVEGSVPCGFTTDADFFVVPVPEPGSLALLGAALLGFAGLRRRKLNKA